MTPRIREQILAEWRGGFEPKRSVDRFCHVGEVCGGLMKQLGLADRLREEDIRRTWQEIVGDFLASHSQPDNIRDGVLLVRVIQPTLLYELDRVWKKDLIRKLQARFGAKKIRDVRFRAG